MLEDKHYHTCMWCLAEWRCFIKCETGPERRTICLDCAEDQLTKPTPNSDAFKGSN